MGLLRLDKIISSCGIASRREIKTLIRSGRVSVDGAIASSAEQKYDPEKVKIAVDGENISYKVRHIIMLNKPAGYITATEDGKDKTVIDLLSNDYKRIGVFPIGRLDKDTEGLLLLTDDGDFCHNIITPSKEIAKIYYAEVSGVLSESDGIAFKEGIELANGQKCIPGELKILPDKKSGYVLVYEGKYHQVKRMLASLGKPVTYLKRVAIGGIILDATLEKGAFREITEVESKIVFDKKKMLEIFDSLK